MGLFFTLLFVLTAYLSPETMFGSLSQYHIEVVLALITMVVSLFSAAESGILEIPQTYALFGLSAAVTFSIIFNGWFSGGPLALIDFLPGITPFWFVFLNCRKKIHLQLLVAVCFIAALFIIVHGFIAVHSHVAESPYFLMMKSDADQNIYRIRGLSFLNDPNDLSQFMVSLIPLTFFFWVKGKTFRNFFLVFLPACVLIYGMYLAESRGGMLALIALSIYLLRRKIGTFPSVLIGIVFFVGLTAIGFTGGRNVSASSGEDRMGAWSAGIELIRAHPLFGVGIHSFTDHYEITAHNTVVVCAAELGLPGLFFWFLFVVPTVRDAFVGGKDEKDEERARLRREKKNYGPPGLPNRSPRPALPAGPAVPAGGGSLLLKDVGRASVGSGSVIAAAVVPARSGAIATPNPSRFLDPNAGMSDVSDEELRRMSRVAVLSLIGFLTAGWFLSRAYTMILFVNAGIVASLYRMERERGIAPGIMPFSRAMKYSAIAVVIAIATIYFILRVDHLMGN